MQLRFWANVTYIVHSLSLFIRKGIVGRKVLSVFIGRWCYTQEKRIRLQLQTTSSRFLINVSMLDISILTNVKLKRIHAMEDKKVHFRHILLFLFKKKLKAAQAHRIIYVTGTEQILP